MNLGPSSTGPQNHFSLSQRKNHSVSQKLYLCHFLQLDIAMAEICRAPLESAVLQAPFPDPWHLTGSRRRPAPPWRSHQWCSGRSTCGSRGRCRSRGWPYDTRLDQLPGFWSFHGSRNHGLLHGPNRVLNALTGGGNVNEYLPLRGLGLPCHLENRGHFVPRSHLFGS